MFTCWPQSDNLDHLPHTLVYSGIESELYIEKNQSTYKTTELSFLVSHQECRLWVVKNDGLEVSFLVSHQEVVFGQEKRWPGAELLSLSSRSRLWVGKNDSLEVHFLVAHQKCRLWVGKNDGLKVSFLISHQECRLWVEETTFWR